MLATHLLALVQVKSEFELLHLQVVLADGKEPGLAVCLVRVVGERGRPQIHREQRCVL